MTYLTQMTLNPARRAAGRLLGSPRAMHAAVLAGYAGDPGRILWRVDRGERHEATLYVVGPVEPDLTHLVEQIGWPLTQTWRTTSYDPFLRRLGPGQSWHYRIMANPTYTTAPGDGRRGTVRPHVTAGHQEQWLRQKAVGWGFAVADGGEGVLATRRSSDAFTKKDDETARRVTLARVQLEGILTVQDADALRAALVQGMGRAKAYGCGLMTLAPVG